MEHVTRQGYERLQEQIQQEYYEAERRAKHLLEQARTKRDNKLELLADLRPAEEPETPVSNHVGLRVTQLIYDLPGVFDREDIMRAVEKAQMPGVTRSIIKHALGRLRTDGHLRVVAPSNGTTMSRYTIVNKSS
jgi:hypothetical protein